MPTTTIETDTKLFPPDNNKGNRHHQDDEHVLGGCHHRRQPVGFFIGDKEHVARFFAGHAGKRWKYLV
jgi:hypothetical protein